MNIKYILIYKIIFACLFTFTNVIKADVLTDINEVRSNVYSSDLGLARKTAKLFATKNLEKREASALVLIKDGVLHNDEKVRLYFVSALYRLIVLSKSISELDEEKKKQYKIIDNLLHDNSIRQLLFNLAEDKSSKINNVSIQALQIGYGSQRDIELLILRKLQSEPSADIRRDYVRVLGYGKYTSDDTISTLMAVLDNERGEASEVSAIILSSIEPKILDAIPKILTLIESDERYADADLIDALMTYKENLIPYLGRITVLKDGVKTRSVQSGLPNNFSIHTDFLLSKISQLETAISESIPDNYIFDKEASKWVDKTVQLNDVSMLDKQKNLIDGFVRENISEDNYFYLYLLIFLILVIIIGAVVYFRK